MVFNRLKTLLNSNYLHYFGANIKYLIKKETHMLSISEFIILFLLFSVVWLWYDIISKRELAIFEGKRLASNLNLQLLDDTVHCNRMSIVRSESNWPSIKRVYYFNLSSTTNDRLNCQITLLGNKLTHWYVPPYPSNL
tara:strand:+ start:237 stop:650 length:414 start_codon:yes stop_codon:yes gene_type:complete